MEIVLLGHMGRDEALADRLLEHKLHVIGQWENPGLVDKTSSTGGQFEVVDSITNTRLIGDIVQDIQPDMFLTNFDDALAAGVVDTIRQRVTQKRMPDLLIPCPDKGASRIEWDKFYLRKLIDEINPKYNPINFMVERVEDVDEAIDYFESQDTEIAIKPRNLTGGKGVKVMGKHFDSFTEGKEYVLQVLGDNKQSGVEIQEKIEGHEFTLQIFTDGFTTVKPPATYDYPYREDGDTGPGTGGMGAFSMKDGKLPFITDEDYSESMVLIDQLLQKLGERGHDYKGVLYPTFFKTQSGLKIVEVNARGGDPELINILDLLDDDVDLGEVLRQIASGELSEESMRFKKLASAMVYLVSPDYGYSKGPAYEFIMDTAAIAANSSRVRFAAAERTGNDTYQTIGSSRTVGISSSGHTPWDARNNIQRAIKDGFVSPLLLEYRDQIAQEEYIKRLAV